LDVTDRDVASAASGGQRLAIVLVQFSEERELRTEVGRQRGQIGCRGRQDADAFVVELSSRAHPEPAVRVEDCRTRWPRPFRVRRVKSVGVDPTLQDRQTADQRTVELRVRAGGGDPYEV